MTDPSCATNGTWDSEDDPAVTLHDAITALADKWEHDLWPGRIQAIRELRAVLEQHDEAHRTLLLEADWLDEAARNAAQHGYTEQQIEGFRWAAGWVRFHAERPLTGDTSDVVQVDDEAAST